MLRHSWPDISTLAWRNKWMAPDICRGWQKIAFETIILHVIVSNAIFVDPYIREYGDLFLIWKKIIQDIGLNHPKHTKRRGPLVE